MKKLKSNKGSSVTILGISCIIIVFLVAIFVVDFAKALYIKNMYTSYAQKAVQTAVKQQDSLGGLKPESASVAVKEYLIQRDGSVNTADGKTAQSSCARKGNYPKITIKYDNKRGKDAKGKTYYSQSKSIPNIRDSGTFYQNRYNIIQVDIVDVTDNYFYGIFGVPCMEINVKASAQSTSSVDQETITHAK